MVKNPDNIDGRREQEPILATSIETATETSAHHPERNEDAALGDVSRLEQEAQNPPGLDTADPAADQEVIRQYGERERQAADKLAELGVTGAFDGVSGGGTGSGAIASRIAAGTIAETMARLTPEADVEATKQALAEAFTKANENVREYAYGDPDRQDLAGAATTADIVRVVETNEGPELVWGHAGDSRVYVLDGQSGELRCLTTDDGIAKYFNRQKDRKHNAFPDRESLLEQQAAVTEVETQLSYVDKLKMRAAADDPKEAQLAIDNVNDDRRIAYRKNNVVANQIGVDPEQHKSTGIEPYEIGSAKLNPGDRVLISSDGIHDNLTEQEMAEIMRQGGGAAELKEAARQRAELAEISEENLQLNPELKNDREFMAKLEKKKVLAQEQKDLKSICVQLKTKGGPLPPNATVEQANQAIHQTTPEERQAAAKYLKDFDPDQEISRLDLYERVLPELQKRRLIVDTPKMDDITAVEVRVESLEMAEEGPTADDGEQLREMAQDLRVEVAVLEQLQEAVRAESKLSEADRRLVEKHGGPEGLADKLAGQKLRLITAERSAVKADFDRLAKESGLDPEQQLDQAIQENERALSENAAQIEQAASEAAPDTEQRMDALSAKQAELLDRKNKLEQARELSGKMAELSAERQRLLRERKQQKSDSEQDDLDQARRGLSAT